MCMLVAKLKETYQRIYNYTFELKIGHFVTLFRVAFSHTNIFTKHHA